MLFSEALNAMLEGNYCTRDIWDNKNEYCVFMPGMQYIWKILPMPTPNAGNHVFSVDDFLARDWKIYGRVFEQGVAVGEYNPNISASVL